MVRHLDRNSSVAWLVQSQSSTEGSGAAAAVGSAVTVVMVPPVFREAGLSVQRWLGSGKWRALQCGVMYTALQRGTGMGCTHSVWRPLFLVSVMVPSGAYGLGLAGMKVLLVRWTCGFRCDWTRACFGTPSLGRLAPASPVCAAACCSTPRGCVGSTPMLFGDLLVLGCSASLIGAALPLAPCSRVPLG
jgi:hypothetical protein